MRSLIHGLILATLIANPAAAGLSGGDCIGDCSGDGIVMVDEIIVGVRIALDELPQSACPDGGPGYSISGLVTAVRLALQGCTSQRDYSDFTHFTFERQRGYGFCPPAGLYAAEISSSAAGVRFTRSSLGEARPGVDECLPNAWSDDLDCPAVHLDADRLLTADEVRMVRQAFAGVTFDNGPHPFCLHGVVDPCLVTGLAWDGQSATDFTCASRRLDRTDLLRLEDLLSAILP
jgi:hypothetical protein